MFVSGRGLRVLLLGALTATMLAGLGAQSAGADDTAHVLVVASCGQLDVFVPQPGAYSYSVESKTSPTVSGSFTTTEKNENVTIGGIFSSGQAKITVKHGSQIAATTKWQFVNCATPPGGPQGKEGKEGKEGKPGPEGKEGKEGGKGATGATGPAGATGNEGKEGKEGPQGKEGTEGKPGPEGKEGKAGLSVLSEAEQSALKEVLPCIKFVAKGIAAKPTVQIVGCNLQIINGEGKTESANGAGNLVIGYDEPLADPFGNVFNTQTGSHNLILGTGGTFTSYAGIVTGQNNFITAPFASVLGGRANQASGELSTVGGGNSNKASGLEASISGGVSNVATQEWTSVSGGENNKATGPKAWVGGGFANTASGEASSVFGGKGETAGGPYEAKP